MPTLTTRALLFLLAQTTGALLICALALTSWTSSGTGTFLTLLALALVSGTMKVVLPGVQGNLSASYIFLVWGIARMGLGETLVMGWAASFVQSYWHCKKKPAAVQLLFNWSVITISIGAGSLAFKAHLAHELVPSPVLRILLAALVYFVVNTWSVSCMIGFTERLTPWNVWRTSYLWSFPHYLVSASLVIAVRSLENVFGIEVALLVLPPAYMVYHVFVMQIKRLDEALAKAEKDKRHAQEIANLHKRTIQSLALAIEAKDQTTAEHLHRVQTYAMGLAEEFALAPDEMEALRVAAVLHDVGKIAVPEHIISKPGKLTPEEFKAMKIHTVVGAEIVASADFPYAVAPLVRGHHEKWDGSGYPDGLKGEEIPLGARILTAVDCLDALASDRQYRKAMPLDQAMAMIVAESGKSFDPQVVEALRRRCYELESLAKSTMPKNLVVFSINATVDRGLAPDAGYAVGSQSSDKGYILTQEGVAQEASILNSIHAQIGQGESIEADLLAVQARLDKLIPFDCVALFRQRGDKLVCTIAAGEASSLLFGLNIEIGTGASGWTIASRMPLLNGNAATEFGHVEEAPAGFPLRSSLSIPLESEFGPLGVLTLYGRQPNSFQTSHLRALLAVGSRFAYQMNIDRLGSTREELGLSCQSDGTTGTQLAQLSAAIESESALSTQLQLHGT